MTRTATSVRNWEFSLTRLHRFNHSGEDRSLAVLSSFKASGQNTLFPDLTNFEHASPGHN
jgi:hypothetical protein